MKWSQWYYYSLQSKSIYSSSLWFQLLIYCVSSSSPARFSGSFEIPRSNADPRRRRPGSHRKHRRWISALPAWGECGGRPRWEVRAPPPTLDGTPDRHPERGDCNSVRAADLFVFSGPSGRLRLRGATWFPGLLLLFPLPPPDFTRDALKVSILFAFSSRKFWRSLRGWQLVLHSDPSGYPKLGRVF